jgi:hypothetical protein
MCSICQEIPRDILRDHRLIVRFRRVITGPLMSQKPDYSLMFCVQFNVLLLLLHTSQKYSHKSKVKSKAIPVTGLGGLL